MRIPTLRGLLWFELRQAARHAWLRLTRTHDYRALRWAEYKARVMRLAHDDAAAALWESRVEDYRSRLGL